MEKRTPAPHEVFTPGEIPLKEHNVYVPRTSVEKRLRQFLQRNQVAVVFGEYGVGKTTVVQRFLRDEVSPDRVVYISSVSGKSLLDVFAAVLERIEYSVPFDHTLSRTKSGQGGLDLIVVKGSGRVEETEQVTRRHVVSSPTDSKFNALLREHDMVVVLDEMHRASEDFRHAVADWIKATRTGEGSFGLYLIGTSMDAQKLVAPDPGIDRYVKEAPVSLLSDEEAEYIVVEGFKTLEMGIGEELVSRIVRTAAGAPTIVQALCLDASENALDAGRVKLVSGDLAFAVDRYLEENGKRLLASYFKAIETTGPKRYRKRVLHAVASAAGDYVTMEEIRDHVSESLAEDVPSTALSGPLRMLKEDDYGPILQDVDRVVSGSRVHNLTAFVDPMMKSFVRFMMNLDRTELMPNEQRLLDIASEDQMTRPPE